MGKRILDSCVLINLFAGWGNFDCLRELGHECYVCEAVAREAQFVRDTDLGGTPILKRIDFQPFLEAGALILCRPETPDEQLSYVDFAVDLDDGEAQALALAKHRQLVLVTDEKPGLRIAATPAVGVSTLTTPALLKEWASLNADNERRMVDIVRRIGAGARYHAPRDNPLYDWWQSLVSAS